VFEEAIASIRAKFPYGHAPKGMTLLRVDLHEGASVRVVGFGLPFANEENPVLDGVINRNWPHLGGMTLVDILEQRTFYFVLPQPADYARKNFALDRIPAQVGYPYELQEYHPYTLKYQIKNSRGDQFRPTFRYKVNVCPGLESAC
jgi:hypothetical protein